MTENSLLWLFGLAVIAPVMAGIVALFGKNRTSANTAVQFFLACSGVFGLAASVSYLFAALTQGMGALVVAFPFLNAHAFLVDSWSAFFFGLMSFGVLLSSLFAMGYLPRYAKVYSFPVVNLATAFFIFGMQVTLLAGTVFAFLLYWEVMSLAAYFLVIADREEASMKAGFIYLLMTHIGFACLLIGFFLLSQGNIDATFDMLMRSAASLPLTTLGVSFFFLFAGFGSKAGLVPLHQWLPYAHPQAPSQSSALMSGVMLKVAVYGFLRVALFIFPLVPLSWAMIVVVIGLISAVFGVLYAAVETDLKRLLAWSSIENMGIVFSAIGLALVFKHFSLDERPFLLVALFHALNHTVFKTGLFLSAGAIISETHTKDLDQLGGLAKPWPVFSFLFLCLALAAAALPPLGTFYGEWILLQHLAMGMTQGTSVMVLLLGVVISVIALVGGLAIFTFANVFSAIFLSRPRTSHAEKVKPLGGLMVLPVGVSALMVVLLGVFAAPITAFLQRIFISPVMNAALPLAQMHVSGGAVQPGWIVLIVAVIGVIIVLWRRFATVTAKPTITETWDCGQPVTPRMEYTATGFSAPIRFFFRFLLMPYKHLKVEPIAPGNPWIARRSLEWGTRSLWETWLYEPLAKTILHLSKTMKRLQSGVIQFYILLILVTLVIVLIVAL